MRWSVKRLEGRDIKVPETKQLNSEALFGDAKEILILHLGECYVLTITRQKKLLLTKVNRELPIQA